MSMHGTRLSLSLVGGIKGGKQLDQEAATLVGGRAYKGAQGVGGRGVLAFQSGETAVR